MRKASQLKNKFANDSRLRDFKTLETGRKLRMQAAEGHRSKNEDFYDFNQGYENEYDPTTGINAFNTSETGIVQVPNYRVEMEKITDNSKASVDVGRLKNTDGIQGYLNRYSVEELATKGIIKKEEKAVLDNYLNGPAGRVQLRAYQHPDYGNMTREEAEKAILSEMYGVGSERDYVKKTAVDKADLIGVQNAKKVLDESQAKSYYGQELTSAWTNGGTTVSPKNIPQFVNMELNPNSLTKKAGVGNTYTFTGNQENFVINNSSGDPVSAPVLAYAAQIGAIGLNLNKSENNLYDMHNIDDAIDNFGDGLDLLKYSILNPLSTNDAKAGYNAEQQVIIRDSRIKLETLRKANPNLYAKAVYQIQSGVTDGKALKRLMVRSTLQGATSTVDFLPSSETNNLKMMNGQYGVSGVGYMTKSQMRQNMGYSEDDDDFDDVYDVIIENSGATSETHEIDGEKITFVRIPDLTVKGSPNASAQRAYDQDAYDKQLDEGQQKSIERDYEERSIALGKLTAKQNEYFNAIDLAIGQDRGALDAIIQRDIENTEEFTTAEKTKLKKKLTDIQKYLLQSKSTKAETAYREYLDKIYEYKK